ncbi:MAG TPA: cysteine desulfurase family protein [Caulobacteraceae bacterium]
MSAAVYLDYNATAKVRPEAARAVADALAGGGNPSSVHAAGRAARSVVDAARADVAALAGAASSAVIFVSGGTEANALGIQSAVAAGFTRLIVGATEHDAVRESAATSGLPVETWPVTASGLGDLVWLEAALANGGCCLVCLMLANNETGVIQPVAQAAAIVRRAGGWLHVDAVQAAGKIAIDVSALGADTLALSAHKLGGPQGIGALIAGERATIMRQQHGGRQEGGRRAGTENVPGIAGFGAAARAAARDLPAIADQAAWRDSLAERMRGEGAVVLGEGAPRLPQTLCVATDGFASDLQVMALDLAGVMISAGAACSSGKVKPSAVISEMGQPELAPFSIRISGGWATTEADWRRCGEAWTDAWRRCATRRLELV